MVGAVLGEQMGDGVRLIEPGGENGEVIAVLVQTVGIAQMWTQAPGGIIERGEVGCRAFHEQIEGNVVIADEAGIERGGRRQARGKSFKSGDALGGIGTALRQPGGIGAAIRQEDDATVIDDGMGGERNTHAAVGIKIARGDRNHRGVCLPVRQ